MACPYRVQDKHMSAYILHHNAWSIIYIMKRLGSVIELHQHQQRNANTWLLKKSQEALFKNRIRPLLPGTSFRPSYPQEESNHTSCFFFVCTKLIIVWSLPVVSIHCQFFLNEKGDTWIKPFNSNLMTLQTSTSLRLFVFLLLWFYTLSCYGSTTQQWIIGANRLLLF
jgi:hypothetical protein